MLYWFAVSMNRFLCVRSQVVFIYLYIVNAKMLFFSFFMSETLWFAYVDVGTSDRHGWLVVVISLRYYMHFGVNMAISAKGRMARV